MYILVLDAELDDKLFPQMYCQLKEMSAIVDLDCVLSAALTILDFVICTSTVIYTIRQVSHDKLVNSSCGFSGHLKNFLRNILMSLEVRNQSG